jgi:Tfp pilus assembly protein PilF
MKDARRHETAPAKPRTGRWVLPLTVVALVAAAGVVYWLANPEPDRRAEALQLVKLGKLAEAEPLLVRANERDGNDAEVVAALAVVKLGGTDTAAAERYLSRWCELRPEEARPFQLRMDLRHRVSRGMVVVSERVRTMETAFEDGRRVLELEPTNDAVRREVAWLAMSVGRHADAEAECRRSLAASPHDSWLNFLLARVLHVQGKRTEAAEVLDAVVRAKPDFGDALLLRAILYRESDQPAQAVTMLRQALTLKGCPRRDCLYHLGLALAASGQADEARKAMAEVDLLNLTAAVSNDHFPNNPAMRVQIAEAMLGVGRLPEANAELDAVLAGSPEFAPAHRIKALYYDRVGQPERAAEHRRRAGRDAP